jgi:catechol 2,3-dioxygenase-like lactoylglutathione lyase family enzyme
MFKLDHLDHVALNVRDLEHSAQWYQEVLGLERRHAEIWPVPVFLCAGVTGVALFPADNPDRATARAEQRNVGAVRHVAFRADRQQFQRAQSALRQRGIEFDFENHTIAQSIYFRDPDGHVIEITTYEVR